MEELKECPTCNGTGGVPAVWLGSSYDYDKCPDCEEFYKRLKADDLEK